MVVWDFWSINSISPIVCCIQVRHLRLNVKSKPSMIAKCLPPRDFELRQFCALQILHVQDHIMARKPNYGLVLLLAFWTINVVFNSISLRLVPRLRASSGSGSKGLVGNSWQLKTRQRAVPDPSAPAGMVSRAPWRKKFASWPSKLVDGNKIIR